MVGLPAGPLRRAVLEQVLAVDVPDPELAEQVAAWEQEKAVLDGWLVVELAEPARRRPTNSVNSANSVRLRGVDEFAADELALMLRLAPRAARTAANQPNSATSTIAGPGSTAESPPPASKRLLISTWVIVVTMRSEASNTVLDLLVPLGLLVLSSGGQMQSDTGPDRAAPNRLGRWCSGWWRPCPARCSPGVSVRREHQNATTSYAGCAGVWCSCWVGGFQS